MVPESVGRIRIGFSRPAGFHLCRNGGLAPNIDVMALFTGMPFLGISRLHLIVALVGPATVGADGDPSHCEAPFGGRWGTDTGSDVFLRGWNWGGVGRDDTVSGERVVPLKSTLYPNPQIPHPSGVKVKQVTSAPHWVVIPVVYRGVDPQSPET